LETDNRIASYTAAGVFPVKLLTADILKDGLIVPYHIQVCPTNRCNLKCTFCSCKDRDRNVEIPFDEMKELLKTFSDMGTRAMTITGGGEPLLYPEINSMIDMAYNLNIKSALVTNGIEIDRINTKKIIWLRLSFGDSRQSNSTFIDKMSDARAFLYETTWSMSYVITRNPDYDKLRWALKLSKELNFTYIRLVSDLLDVEATPPMSDIKSKLLGSPGEDLIIYQGRKDYSAGRKRCLISLLKPVIAADGNIYPCCGAQYAIPGSKHDYTESMKMGNWRDFLDIYKEQYYYDGSKCSVCYYDSYNTLLALMVQHREHEDFV